MWNDYTVAVDVKKLYHVTVYARSHGDAERQVARMQTEEIYEQGKLADVETTVVETIQAS